MSIIPLIFLIFLWFGVTVAVTSIKSCLWKLSAQHSVVSHGHCVVQQVFSDYPACITKLHRTQQSPILPPIAPPAIFLFCASLNLSILEILYKWDHAVLSSVPGLFYLTESPWDPSMFLQIVGFSFWKKFLAFNLGI